MKVAAAANTAAAMKVVSAAIVAVIATAAIETYSHIYAYTQKRGRD